MQPAQARSSPGTSGKSLRRLVQAACLHVGRAVVPLFLLLLFCGFLFFFRLGDRGLWSAHEGRAAQNAQSILREGCWGLPRLFDGHAELQKPPLYYALVALCARWRGGTVTAWDVRLPAAAGALATVLLLFAFLHGQGRTRAGFLAALILASAVHFTWMARVGRIDMPLTLTTSVALLAFHAAALPSVAARRQAALLALIGYCAVAAGIMLKGPIGAVLPAVVMGLQALLRGKERRFGQRPAWPGRSSLWWGIPLVLLLTAPWFWWANERTNGQLFRVFFLHHNLKRGLGAADDLKTHPWWFYGPRFLIDFLPWSPLLLVGIYWGLVEMRRRAEPGRRSWLSGAAGMGNAEARLGLAWFAGMFVLLSLCSFKRADYLLPAYPGAALFLGCMVDRWYAAVARPRLWAATGGSVLAGCLVGWWLFSAHFLPLEETRHEQRPFAAAIRRLAPQPQYVLFFRAECHDLAFQLGYPLDTFLEWENLDVWAGRPGPHYIIMPPECAADWPRHVNGGRLIEVLRNTDLVPGLPHHQQLVLMRTERFAGDPPGVE